MKKQASVKSLGGLLVELLPSSLSVFSAQTEAMATHFNFASDTANPNQLVF